MLTIEGIVITVLVLGALAAYELHRTSKSNKEINKTIKVKTSGLDERFALFNKAGERLGIDLNVLPKDSNLRFNQLSINNLLRTIEKHENHYVFLVFEGDSEQPYKLEDYTDVSFYITDTLNEIPTKLINTKLVLSELN